MSDDDIIPDGDPEVARQIDEALGRKIPLPEFLKSTESVPSIELSVPHRCGIRYEYEDGEVAQLRAENKRLRIENEGLQREVAEHKARIEEDRAIIAKLFVDCDRLRQDKMRLRAALELFASDMNWSSVIDERGNTTCDWYWDPIPWVAGKPWEIARRALSPESEGKYE